MNKQTEEEQLIMTNKNEEDEYLITKNNDNTQNSVQEEGNYNNHQDIEQQPQQQHIAQPTSSEILIWQEELQKQNFGLILNLIQYLPDPNELDLQGFGLLHYAVTFNNLETVKTLIRRGLNIDVLSRYSQTPLSLACSYGFIEITKYLIDNGAKVDHTDVYGFTPLFYAAKSKQYPLVLYLVSKGARFREIQDSNGCSLVHWASYNNDLFLLRIIKAIGVSIDLQDKQGFTPFARACHNFSYDSCRHISEKYPDMICYQFDIQNSKTLAKLINNVYLKIQLSSSPIYYSLMNLSTKTKQYLLTFLFLSFVLNSMVTIITSQAFQDLSQSQTWFIYTLVYILELLYFALCAVMFIHKTTNKQDDGSVLMVLKQREPSQHQQQQSQQSQEEEIKLQQPEENKTQSTSQSQNINIATWEQNSKPVSWYMQEIVPKYLNGITLREFLSINYKPVETFMDTMINKPPGYFKFASSIAEHQQEINQLIEINDPLWYQCFSIIHQVYFLFETGHYKAIHSIDWNRICPTCLQYKQPRTSHCKECNICVYNFEFHSKFYGKCINHTNHLFYTIFNACLWLSLFIWVLFQWVYYIPQCISRYLLRWYVFYLIEIVYLILEKEKSFYLATIYILYSFWLLYLSLFIFIDFICGIQNMTYNELMNSQRYRYLYEPTKLKNDKFYLKWKPRFPYGVGFNLITYVATQIRHLKIM